MTQHFAAGGLPGAPSLMRRVPGVRQAHRTYCSFPRAPGTWPTRLVPNLHAGSPNAVRVAPRSQPGPRGSGLSWFAGKADRNHEHESICLQR